MPSDGAAPAGWLRSQGLGLVCGFLTVLLLGVGSVVLAATRETASAGIRMDELGGFFEPPRLEHTWLYLLVPVLLLYALNTLLCTWDSLLLRLRRRTREASAYAPVVIHVSFLLSLLAHAVGGAGAHEGRPVTLGPQWSEVGELGQARITRFSSEALPDGRLKSVDLRLEVKDAAGRVREEQLGYNQPVTSGLGARSLLLSQVDAEPGAANLSVGGERCRVQAGESCAVGGRTVALSRFFTQGHWGNQPVAAVRVEQGSAAAEHLYLLLGQPHRLADGALLQLEGVEPRPVVTARLRVNPGAPVALLAVVLLGLGLAVMGRRWVWPH